ncbi:UNVERIFIED_CONTAM: hypothetical protein Sradi_2121500 [Sesamum radiatum]|uniref:F-box domain-containing protein n=1 Tax=Sesamum radiatum TaxID=300843 RepID=A0AAW2TJ94_SESRA
MAGRIMADWSKLPYDIIHKVATYLMAVEDFLAFSAVCRSWRSVYVAKQWHQSPQLAFCRPGYSSWKTVKDISRTGYIDVTHVKDQIFALCGLGSLVVIDIDSLAVTDINGPKAPEHVALSLPLWHWEQLILVESSGDLWMVYQNRTSIRSRSSVESTEFYVYTFDFSKKRWIRLSSLGNHAIFVGDNCSMSIRAPDRFNCKSNSIYFIGKRMEQRWPCGEVHVDLGVHSITNGISEPLCFGPGIPKHYSFPLWVTPTF